MNTVKIILIILCTYSFTASQTHIPFATSRPNDLFDGKIARMLDKIHGQARYSVNTDTSVYVIPDTISWTVKLINIGIDTLYINSACGVFYFWHIIDSLGTMWDGNVICDSAYLNSPVAPGDSLMDKWITVEAGEEHDLVPGLYFGLMRPWLSVDSLPFDTCSFRIQMSPLISIRTKSILPNSCEIIYIYPNPFNPNTTIRFGLPEPARTRLVVYDLLGREVVRLVDGHLEPGYHAMRWNGKTAAGIEVPSGIYIARLVTPEYSKSIKMVLLK